MRDEANRAASSAKAAAVLGGVCSPQLQLQPQPQPLDLVPLADAGTDTPTLQMVPQAFHIAGYDSQELVPKCPPPPLQVDKYRALVSQTRWRDRSRRSSLDLHGSAFDGQVSGLAKARGWIPQRVVHDRPCRGLCRHKAGAAVASIASQAEKDRRLSSHPLRQVGSGGLTFFLFHGVLREEHGKEFRRLLGIIRAGKLLKDVLRMGGSTIAER